ncbi:hypothetical protein F511_16549 [Dorcoceras hygrometricum]|uniref:Uncharacterized protein n=1 Tax=Dorcoceras hygrometricum TaxID=472368 RepID=A0A2Z7AVH6_9LAMI|nr:hypothetical protein F511_16549 [Dorcoceras hygrometricum]
MSSRCHYSICIAIRSIATLDLPMVVDLIGIYGLKGPYCTLTTTDWFFHALSVIPMGSWGDVARRFNMIRWAVLVGRRLPSSLHTPPPPPRVAGIRSGRFDEENTFVQNSSVLLVQADEGVSVLVVDRIGDIYHSLPRRADVIVTTVGARHKCQQAMMTSAVMSSQSAVDKKRKSWISDDDISSDVITISSELQYIQSLATVQPVDVACTSRPMSGQLAASMYSPSGQPVASMSRSPADVPVTSYSDPDAMMNSAVAQRQKKSALAIKMSKED